jgi:hypothetical protein
MSKNNIPVQLEDFVHTAIVQIMRAVDGASTEVKTFGGEINPRPSGEDRDLAAARISRAVGGGSLTFIDFDIAVTATRGGGRDSGIGVLFAGIKAGISEKNSHAHETVSRISFKVPVRFPRK